MRMHLEKICLDQVQNGCLFGHYSLSHSRYLVTVLDGLTITIKQNVRFQERMHLEKFQLDQIQNGLLSAIIHFHMADIW